MDTCEARAKDEVMKANGFDRSALPRGAAHLILNVFLRCNFRYAMAGQWHTLDADFLSVKKTVPREGLAKTTLALQCHASDATVAGTGLAQGSMNRFLLSSAHTHFVCPLTTSWPSV